MNALAKARSSIAKLTQTMRGTSAARQAFQVRQLGPVRSARIVVGAGMIRVLDADTGRCLGFRQTIREARWLAERLERGVA